MKERFTPKVVAGAAAALIALVLVGGWFVLVSPQKSKATTLNAEISEAQSKLTVTQLLARSLKSGKGRSASALLATAMPPELQMPLVLRQVQKLAETSKVRLDSFAPSAATPLSGYEEVPIAVSVAGRYAAVQRFLNRLRVQADTKGGRIQASGRLFNVASVSLAPGNTEPDELTASIGLSTFVYTGAPLPVADPTADSTSSSDGTAE